MHESGYWPKPVHLYPYVPRCISPANRYYESTHMFRKLLFEKLKPMEEYVFWKNNFERYW